MKMLRVRADSPPLRELEKRAIGVGRGQLLPRTTLADVLAGRRFPKKSLLLTFAGACGVDVDTDRRWEQTWNRLAIALAKPGLPEQATGPSAASTSARPESQTAAEVLRDIIGALRSQGQDELADRGAEAISMLGASVLGDDDPLVVTPVQSAPRAIVPRQPTSPADAETTHGVLPAIWSVEHRNPDFTGREELLVALQARLTGGGAAVVQALRGMGGVGKTQLAIEYAYRFAHHYEIVWWINAEDPALIGEQLAALAIEMCLVDPGADTATAAPVLKANLRGRRGWLLIFDSAEDPAGLRPWLPGGPGHVIITSRAGGWEHMASLVPVDVMVRSESVQLLRNYNSDLTENEADRLAEELGDLPLALTQAGGFLAETATEVDDYIDLLSHYASAVLESGSTGEYPRPLAAAVTLGIDRLGELDPMGLAVLRLCAFLAPETVPVDWLGKNSALGVGSGGPLVALTQAARSPVKILHSIANISRLGLAMSSRNGVRVHRLIQAVVRDQLDEDDRTNLRQYVRQMLVANHPGDPEDPSTWPGWSRLIPHLLAVDPMGSDAEAPVRDLVCHAGWYLIERGELEASLRLVTALYQRWRADLGPSDLHTLWAARSLTRAWRELGRYDEAQALYEESVPLSRESLGDEHPHTLRFAHGYAINLRMQGRNVEARQMQEDAFIKYRRVLGENHTHTLHSANHLAADLSALGEYEAAQKLHRDTLGRYRSVAGMDHPDTLRSAYNLAVDLRHLEHYDEALELHQDTLSRRRRVLGEDHPYTLNSAIGLSETLRDMGRTKEALQIQQELLVRYRRIMGVDHPETLHCAHNLAVTLHLSGDHEQAFDLEADTVRRYRQVLGPQHPLTARAIDHLARVRPTQSG